MCSYIYNYPIYVEDQQQRSSNISLSPFRSNNNLEKLLVLLVSKNFFCTNKLFSLKLAIGYPEKSAYISTLGHLNLSYIHLFECILTIIMSSHSQTLVNRKISKLKCYQYSSSGSYFIS